MSTAASNLVEGVSLARYEAILAHAELELELAGRGELEELMSLGERWDDLVAALPARPPATAASLLQRAALIHERTHVELIRLRESLLSDFAVADRARRAADGYGRQLGARARMRVSRRA